MQHMNPSPDRKGGVRDPGLLLIGIFKLLKALFFIGVGFGALHFLHHDLSDTLQRIVTRRGFDPENHFVSMVLDRADLITHHRLQQISAGTFAYAALALTEGIGLMRRKVWAEYLTLWLSVSFLPWEIFEMVRDLNWWRGGIFLTNVLIVLYLVWLLRSKRKVSAYDVE